MGWGLVVWWTVGAWFLLVGACRKSTEPGESGVARTPLLTLPSEAKSQTSATCRDCHAKQFTDWHGTDHALANQLIEDADLAGGNLRQRYKRGDRNHVDFPGQQPDQCGRSADGFRQNSVPWLRPQTRCLNDCLALLTCATLLSRMLPIRCATRLPPCKVRQRRQSAHRTKRTCARASLIWLTAPVPPAA